MNFAIIVAGGSGERFSKNIKKQFFKIDSETILEKTLSIFNSNNSIDSIVLVVPEDSLGIAENLKKNFKKLNFVAKGGRERKNSVFNGLRTIENIADEKSKILIHDGVRPFISGNLIEKILTKLDKYECVIPAIKINDTLKKVNDDNFVEQTVDRDKFVRVQTPQGFRCSIIQCYKQVIDNNINFTDDSMIMEYLDKKVKIIEGEAQNIKITTQEDLELIGNYW